MPYGSSRPQPYQKQSAHEKDNSAQRKDTGYKYSGHYQIKCAHLKSASRGTGSGGFSVFPFSPGLGNVV